MYAIAAPIINLFAFAIGKTVHQIGYTPEGCVLEDAVMTYDDDQRLISRTDKEYRVTEFSYNPADLVEFMTVKSNPETVINLSVNNQELQVYSYNCTYNDRKDWIIKTESLVSEPDTNNFRLMEIITRRIEYYE